MGVKAGYAAKYDADLSKAAARAAKREQLKRLWMVYCLALADHPFRAICELSWSFFKVCWPLTALAAGLIGYAIGRHHQ